MTQPNTQSQEPVGLKPCPFCGGEAMIGGGGDHNVMCCDCPTSAVGETLPEAVAAWNRRAQTVTGSGELAEALTDAWTDFLDANPDGLTSPEDLPDHALVTCDQMIDIVRNALAALRGGQT